MELSWEILKMMSSLALVTYLVSFWPHTTAHNNYALPACATQISTLPLPYTGGYTCSCGVYPCTSSAVKQCRLHNYQFLHHNNTKSIKARITISGTPSTLGPRPGGLLPLPTCSLKFRNQLPLITTSNAFSIWKSTYNTANLETPPLVY